MGGSELPVQCSNTPRQLPIMTPTSNTDLKSQLDDSKEKLKKSEELLESVIQVNEEEKRQFEEQVKALQQQLVEHAERWKNRAQERADEVEDYIAKTKNRAEIAEKRAIEAEQQLQSLQLVDSTKVTPVHRQSVLTQSLEYTWKIQREEIELTHTELGVGGWGCVKLAKFRGSNVAAKEMHSVILTSYNDRLFVREMNIAASVRHPNLVQFIGASVDGSPIILTELMETSLRAHLQAQKELCFVQAQSICLDVAKALNYLHLMRPNAIIHRDVSSANVLLEELAHYRWRAKLSDYGSANFAQLVTTTAPGSPAYSAPESLNCALQSPKMDVFSYGVLMIEIFSRQFPDPSIREEQICNIGLKYAAMVPLVRQCIRTEPKERPDMSVVLIAFD